MAIPTWSKISFKRNGSDTRDLRLSPPRLQQEASNRLGFNAKRTMSVAQRLYEGVELGNAGTTALITYMRTDSVRISDEARDAAREWISLHAGP
jgi:DNA topoisomerase I